MAPPTGPRPAPHTFRDPHCGLLRVQPRCKQRGHPARPAQVGREGLPRGCSQRVRRRRRRLQASWAGPERRPELLQLAPLGLHHPWHVHLQPAHAGGQAHAPRPGVHAGTQHHNLGREGERLGCWGDRLGCCLAHRSLPDKSMRTPWRPGCTQGAALRACSCTAGGAKEQRPPAQSGAPPGAALPGWPARRAAVGQTTRPVSAHGGRRCIGVVGRVGLLQQEELPARPCSGCLPSAREPPSHGHAAPRSCVFHAAAHPNVGEPEPPLLMSTRS